MGREILTQKRLFDGAKGVVTVMVAASLTALRVTGKEHRSVTAYVSRPVKDERTAKAYSKQLFAIGFCGCFWSLGVKRAP